MLSSMKSLIRNPILRFGIIGIVLYIALFFIYEPITLGLDVEDITILAVPTMVGMFLFQYFMSCTVFHRAFLAMVWLVYFGDSHFLYCFIGPM